MTWKILFVISLVACARIPVSSLNDYRARGLTAASVGDLSTATYYYKKCTAYPDNVLRDCVLELSDLYARSNRLDESKQLLTQWLTERDSLDSLAHEHLAAVYAESHEWELALKEYDVIEKLRGPSTNFSEEKANLLISLKRYPESIRVLDRYLSVHPDACAQRRLRAFAFVQMGRAQEAIVDAEACLTLSPTDGQTLAVLHDAQVLNHNLKAAEGILRRMREMTPTETILLEKLADNLVLQGRDTEALVLYQQLNVESNVRRMFVLLRVMALHERNQRPEKAREVAMLVLERDSENVEAEQTIVKSYMSQGRIEEAGRLLKNLSLRYPQHVWIQTTYSRLLFDIGREEEARVIAESLAREVKTDETAAFLSSLKKSPVTEIASQATPIPVKAPALEGRTYIVRQGDTLGEISQTFYKTKRYWRQIFELNQGRFETPESIPAGTRIILPDLKQLKVLRSNAERPSSSKGVL